MHLDLSKFFKNKDGQPILPSRLLDIFFRIKGQKWGIEEREIMRRLVMDGAFTDVYIQGGRQIEKSTHFAAKEIIFARTLPNIAILHTAPSDSQTKMFAKERIRPLLQSMPDYEQLFPRASDRVRVRSIYFPNTASTINIEHSGETGDRLRGFSADMLVLDEIQDMSPEAVFTLQETTSHSALSGGITLAAGTAKTTEHMTQWAWEHSTQGEFLIKCPHCGHWNIPTEKNIGENGLVCSKCGKPISIDDGKIVMRKPIDKARFVGIRFPQIIAPHLAKDPLLWKKNVWNKYNETTDRTAILNEMLGLPAGSVNRPITKETMIALSHPQLKNEIPTEKRPYIITIDWGTGRQSFTVMTVVDLGTPGRYIVRYIKRYEGQEADANFYLPHMLKVIEQIKPIGIFADWGFSGGNIDLLMKRTNYPVYPMINTSSKTPIRANKQTGFISVNKTDMLSTLFAEIKMGNVIFFNQQDMEAGKFYDEFTGWFIDFKEDNKGNKKLVYRHAFNQSVDVSITAAMAMPAAAYIGDPKTQIVSNEMLY